MQLERLRRRVVDTAAAVVRDVAAFVRGRSPYSDGPLRLGARVTMSLPPVPLWTRVHTEQYQAEIGGFLRRVIGLDDEAFYFNDGTTLDDICSGYVDVCVRQTREIYGVEISDIQPPYLWMIAKRIHDGPHAWPARPPRSARDSILADFETDGFDKHGDDVEGSLA